MSSLEDGQDHLEEAAPIVEASGRPDHLSSGSSRGFSFSFSNGSVSLQNLSALASSDRTLVQFANDLRLHSSSSFRQSIDGLAGAASETDSLLPAVTGPPIPANNNTEDNNDPSNNDDNTTNLPNNPSQLRDSVLREFNQMHQGAKLWLGFAFLLLLKFLLDHFVRCALIISILYSLVKIKAATEMQMSLKSRSSMRTLLSLFSFSSFILLSMLFFFPLLGYTEHLSLHLTLRLETLESSSVWQVLWNVFLVDTLLLAVGQELKTLICLLGSCKHPYITMAFKYLFPNLTGEVVHGREGSTRGTSASSRSSAADHHDLEGGGSSRATTVLRRTSNDSTHEHNHALQSIDQGVSLDESVGDSSDSSDATDSWDYLLKLKLCKLVDITLYLYRYVLPAPLWIAYFNTGGSVIITTGYIVMKALDGQWKMRAGFETILQMIHKKLEFGHYSTAEEYDPRTSHHDCPICFEAPKVPVTLDCQHIFCEVCVSEWLDKEKTCPVCRAEVKRISPNMDIIQKEAASCSPILV